MLNFVAQTGLACAVQFFFPLSILKRKVLLAVYTLAKMYWVAVGW